MSAPLHRRVAAAKRARRSPGRKYVRVVLCMHGHRFHRGGNRLRGTSLRGLNLQFPGRGQGGWQAWRTLTSKGLAAWASGAVAPLPQNDNPFRAPTPNAARLARAPGHGSQTASEEVHPRGERRAGPGYRRFTVRTAECTFFVLGLRPTAGTRTLNAFRPLVTLLDTVATVAYESIRKHEKSMNPSELPDAFAGHFAWGSQPQAQEPGSMR